MSTAAPYRFALAPRTLMARFQLLATSASDGLRKPPRGGRQHVIVKFVGGPRDLPCVYTQMLESGPPTPGTYPGCVNLGYVKENENDMI